MTIISRRALAAGVLPLVAGVILLPRAGRATPLPG